MKNIYLTSNGLDVRYKDSMNSYSQIIEVLKAKKVAIIPNAKLKTQDRTVSIVVAEQLKRHGIECSIFDLEKQSITELDKYNAIYFNGGEPKYLMDAIYNNNFYEIIKKFIEAGNVVIGQSAGAMIMNKEYGDTSTGEFLISNNGFDFFDKIIIPHYDVLPEELKSKIPENTFNVNDIDLLIKI